MKRRNFIVGLSALSVTACGGGVVHETRSGKAEVIFNTNQKDKVKAAIVPVFLDRGYLIHNESSYQMSFEKESDNAAAQILLGSRYDHRVFARVTLTFAPQGNKTRVVIDAEAVTNPGSAFERTTKLNNSADVIKIKQKLQQAARNV